MRQIKELELAALTLRAGRMERKEPLGEFVLTQDEFSLLQMQQFEYHQIVGLPERFYGMELRVV